MPTKTKITPPTKGCPFKQTPGIHTHTWHAELPESKPPEARGRRPGALLQVPQQWGLRCPSPRGERTSEKTGNLFPGGWEGEGVVRQQRGEGGPHSPCPRCHRPDAAFIFPCNLNAERGPDEQRTNLWPLRTASSPRTWVHLHAPAQRMPGLGAGFPLAVVCVCFFFGGGSHYTELKHPAPRLRQQPWSLRGSKQSWGPSRKRLF